MNIGIYHANLNAFQQIDVVNKPQIEKVNLCRIVVSFSDWKRNVSALRIELLLCFYTTDAQKEGDIEANKT